MKKRFYEWVIENSKLNLIRAGNSKPTGDDDDEYDD